MTYRTVVLILFAMMLLGIPTGQIVAQQFRVDSAIALMAKSNTPQGLDTPLFKVALGLISTAELTDAQVSQIESAAKAFKKADDESLFYLVKYNIIIGLTKANKNSGIDYAKQTLENLEASKTIHAVNLRLVILGTLRLPYRNSTTRLPEGISYFSELLNRYKRNNDSVGISTCYWVLGGFYRVIGLYDPAIYNMKKSISYFDTSFILSRPYFDLALNIGKYGWISNTGILADYYNQIGDYANAREYGRQALRQAESYYKTVGLPKTGFNLLYTANNLAMANILSNQLDSVDYLLTIAEQAVSNPPNHRGLAFLMQLRAFHNIKSGRYLQADSLLKRCWQLVAQHNIPVSPGVGIIEPDYYLALLRMAENKNADAIALLLRDIERVKSIRPNVLRDYKLLATLYPQIGQPQKAIEYYRSFINLQDSILADQAKFRTISFETEQLMNEKELSIAKLENENKISTLARNFTVGLAVLLLALAGSIYYRFRSKKKANAVLEKTLTELKSTQAQLIQAEKMASLGELTAGIAHEIQNPLNFVNNFSELNTELADELTTELKAGNIAEASSIAETIKDNEAKINLHGKRAESIVKAMLQHTHASSGKKEPHEINALADECLSVAYHGFRAKDKTFQSDFTTTLDPSIGKVNIVQQDIARVLLNLINNAFYAVNEKRKLGIPGYEPSVHISTFRNNGELRIEVKDNGLGISSAHIKKIFQPFFTTKPTGEGTGLGLSLSYDMMKAHGGDILVSSVEGEGSAFTILIPE